MKRNRSSFYFRGLALITILAIALGMPASSAHVSAQIGATATQSISGYLGNKAIEIDDLDNDPVTTPNANMVTDGTSACPDPGDTVSTPNVECPTVAGAEYVDWNDLAIQTSPYGPPAGKYALIDGQGNSDDSFGGTGGSSCLQPAKSPPPKQDVARAYLANNSQYLYFGLVDGTANGSSRHVILFHQNAVRMDTAFCAGDGHNMYLDLKPGDRMIVAFFQPSATDPAAVIYSLVGDPSEMLMNDAVNFANPALWIATDTAVNFAVNTTDIPSDLMGWAVPLKATIFGEGAVSLSSLGITGCGGVYNVSVVTRTTATGSGEAKDYIGGIYDFGSITVQASLAPSCNAEFDYEAQAYDQDGTTPLDDADVTYDWACANAESLSFSAKSGTQAADPGDYTCTLTATQTSSGCSATQEDLSVNVYAAVGANADLAPSCTLDVAYTGEGSGGSGTYDFDWAFSGKCSGSSTTASGTVTLSSGGDCTGDLTVTDAGRADDLVCTATDDDTAAGFKLTVTPSLTDSCNMGLAGDDSTYDATTSGGSPDGVSYDWDFGSTTAGCSVSPASSTAASGGLNVTPPASRGPCAVGADLTVTDLRTDITTCTATGSASTTVYAPIEVSIAPNATELACVIPGEPGSSSGTIGPITFNPTVSGGKPAYTYDWTVDGPNEALGTCGTASSCIVDIPDADYCTLTDLFVTVDDTTDLCAAHDSETENVTKYTEINASNNP